MSPKSKSTIPPLSSIYRRIAISFVVLTVLLVGVIVFFSLSKATIVVTPKDEIKSAEFLVTVRSAQASGALPEGVVAGLYEEKTIEEEVQFEASGATEQQGRAEGKVTLVNTTSSAQPLVATTRLLSEGGILFRMRDAATVPGNGRVEIMAYADETGASGDIGPSKFTIPGLNAAKQKTIYGESSAAMTGGAKTVRTVTSEDLERAKAEVIAKAEQKVKDELKKSPGAALGGVFVSSELLEVVSDAKKGEERQTFTTRAKVNAQMLTYDKAAVIALAHEKIEDNVALDRQIVKFNDDTLVINIKNINSETGEVQLSVYADAQVQLNAASPILDAVKIAGILPKEAQQYLESFDAVESVEIRLFPTWQKRIPTMPDRIKIVIKK
ncbi:hypothetical protein HY477_04190 [Candidatus Uhrbacteria bacterium]|nr:hypothetical protein [Candidatus Uhrbacteria bacterium]